MKKYIFLISLVTLIFCNKIVHAQQAVTDSLKGYCIVFEPVGEIYPSDFATILPEIKMSEYHSSPDRNGVEFRFEMMAIYHFAQNDIATRNATTAAWGMVSKQLHGEIGSLTLDHLNLIVTRDVAQKPTFLVLSWGKAARKWRVLSIAVSNLKTVSKGTRFFTL